MPSGKERAVLIDPDLYMKRMLHYRERHAGWHIFAAVYWAIFIFVTGLIFMTQAVAGYPAAFSLGTSLLLLSVMVVIFGLVNALHRKLMKKYA